MSHNQLAASLAAGKVLFGGWCTTPSSYNAELFAVLGFDYVGIDCQHGLIGRSDMTHMLSAVGHSPATPVVRVAANESHLIGAALDAGAEVVIVPMVNTPAEAAAAVAASKYAPEGGRSFGPARASSFLNRDATPAEVNRRTMCLPMIETIHAVEAVDEICDTPGLAGIYLGPVDLALSMGISVGYEPMPITHGAALEKVRQACLARGLVCGIHADSGASAYRYAEAGFHMVSIASDARLFRLSAEEQLSVARGGTR
jgi:4-hydroxy-2-oxoheptanedioate aldolase